MARGMETSEPVWNYQKPLAINVYGNVAVVHYLWFSTARDASGEENTSFGRFTDVFMKQGNKWVLIADAGGATPGS